MLLFLGLLYACALMLGSLFAVAVAYLTHIFGSNLKLANAKFWGGFAIASLGVAHMVLMPNMFNTLHIPNHSGLLSGVFDMLYRVVFYMVLLTAYEMALVFIEKRFFNLSKYTKAIY